MTIQTGKTIVKAAAEAGNFKALTNAIHTAGLEKTLGGKGPFTVFAPNDDAFEKVPSKNLIDLLADKEKTMKALSHHIAHTKIMSEDIKNLKTIKTIDGGELSVHLHRIGHGIKINDAEVVQPDLECTNGVIHVIDKVLIAK
jgi:uncharacterized surface protein with fasciclin (FAS1) repeats